MAEYIEREAAMLTPVLPKEHRHYQTSNLDDVYAQGWADALDNLKNAPVADVAPVRHGTWLLIGADKRGRGGIFECSACNGCSPHKDPYCPKCGAKMGGKDGDGND